MFKSVRKQHLILFHTVIGIQINECVSETSRQGTRYVQMPTSSLLHRTDKKVYIKEREFNLPTFSIFANVENQLLVLTDTSEAQIER